MGAELLVELLETLTEIHPDNVELLSVEGCFARMQFGLDQPEVRVLERATNVLALDACLRDLGTVRRSALEATSKNLVHERSRLAPFEYFQRLGTVAVSISIQQQHDDQIMDARAFREHT